MLEVLRAVAEVLAVGALAAIAVYLLAFVAAVLWTLRSSGRPDPLARELDAVLAEELELFLSEVVGSPGPAGARDR